MIRSRTGKARHHARHTNGSAAAATVFEPRGSGILRDAKIRIPCSEQTLAKLAVKGQGPQFKRANGRFAVYPVASLDAWAVTRIADPAT